MHPLLRILATVLCLLATLPALAADEVVALDDFEADSASWRYVGGEEFPGAKGSMARDLEYASTGKGSLRLDADFRDGGAYVGLWRELPDFEGRRLVELRLRVRAVGIDSIGIRLGDVSGQCHQANGIALVPDGEWHDLVFEVAKLVDGEHWGGADDGKWHGPGTGLGLNVGNGGATKGAAGALWIDEVHCLVTDEPLGTPTVLPAEIEPRACRPGFGVAVRYRWEAEAMGRDFTVFVHVRGPDGRTWAQDDHEPPTATSVWTGRVEYEHTVVLPVEAPEGRYEVSLGLYDRKASERGWDRQRLLAAEGVGVSDEGDSYTVGSLEVADDAPVPELPPPSIDPSGWKLTFDESFDGPLDVSAWGPGTRWIAHTPYAGDFGDARFADPEEDFPFTVADGLLRIEARKDDHGWRSGLLSSADPKGEGFSQALGYFEMRARLPKGKGTWPAFWLLSVASISDRSVQGAEIDVVEQYGVNPYALHTTVHLWGPNGAHWGEGQPSLVEGMTDDFHTYGALVTEEEIVFFFDRSELWRAPTPEAARGPLYLLVNLALGGGWPIEETPSPSYMLVDYVRAWALP